MMVYFTLLLVTAAAVLLLVLGIIEAIYSEGEGRIGYTGL